MLHLEKHARNGSSGFVSWYHRHDVSMRSFAARSNNSLWVPLSFVECHVEMALGVVPFSACHVEVPPRLCVGPGSPCESDRKVHWFASENLFISHNNTFFIEFLTLFHKKQSEL